MSARLIYRRAWALACHTRMRAGFPRHAWRPRTLAGDRPPRYDEKNATPLRRARACPSPCPGGREHSRGTGPRATCPPGVRRAWALACHTRMRAGFPRHRSRARPVGQDRQILTRSGSGDPELQRWARCLPVFASQGEINTERVLAYRFPFDLGRTQTKRSCAFMKNI